MKIGQRRHAGRILKTGLQDIRVGQIPPRRIIAGDVRADFPPAAALAVQERGKNGRGCRNAASNSQSSEPSGR